MLFETWYQTHFLLYEYCKYMFLQHFLNYNFHIILNNDTINLKLNKPQACGHIANGSFHGEKKCWFFIWQGKC